MRRPAVPTRSACFHCAPNSRPVNSSIARAYSLEADAACFRDVRVNPETRTPGSRIQNFVRADFLSAVIWQPLVVYTYLCIPRGVLVLRVPSSELQLTH